MKDAITAILMLAGGALMLLAAIGVIRMPDLFTRMQASTKGASLGAGLMLAGVAVHFGELGVTTRVVIIIGFIFMTAPISAHLIARASYFVGVPLWKRTVRDELRDRYDARTHSLTSAAIRAEDATAGLDEDVPAR